MSAHTQSAARIRVSRLAEGLGVSQEAHWREDERLEPGGEVQAEPPVDPCESP